MSITVSPLPSTTQKSRETVWENSPVITKVTYTSLSPQPVPEPSSHAPPFRHCPKQKSVSSAGEFWAGGKRYQLGCLTQLIQTSEHSAKAIPEAAQTLCPLLHLLTVANHRKVVQWEYKYNTDNLYLVCPSQKRRCSTFSDAAAIRACLTSESHQRSDFRSRSYSSPETKPMQPKLAQSHHSSQWNLSQVDGPVMWEALGDGRRCRKWCISSCDSTRQRGTQALLPPSLTPSRTGLQETFLWFFLSLPV